MKFDIKEINKLISRIWNYSIFNNTAFKPVFCLFIQKDKPIIKHIKTTDTKQLIKEIVATLKTIKNLEEHNVYYQVLPLDKIPTSGRGTEKDVSLGKFLWADLDYKKTINTDLNVFEEKPDFSLRLTYKEGNKTILVEREPLSSVIERVKNILGKEPTIVVDSGAGYHIYLELDKPYGVEEGLKEVESLLVDVLNADKQSKDLSRLLRLAGTINPRVKRLCRVIYETNNQFSLKELKERLQTLKKQKQEEKQEPEEKELEKQTETKEEHFRSLSITDIKEIVANLLDAYKPSHRQNIVLYLSGWFAKARINPINCFDVVCELINKTNDNEKKMRYSAIVYSYKKAGIDLSKFKEEIERRIGTTLSNVEREIKQEEIKGKSGLEEELLASLGEEQKERVSGIIALLNEKLGVFSPFGDSVVIPVDFIKGVYVKCDFKRRQTLELVRRYIEEENRYEWKVKRVIFNCVIKYIKEFRTSEEDIPKFSIEVETPTRGIIRCEECNGAIELLEFLKNQGLVANNQNASNVLSLILDAYIKNGRGEIKVEENVVGFFAENNKIRLAKRNLREIDAEKLEEALKLLNEIVEYWYGKPEERLPKVVMSLKWGISSPFTYILKEQKNIEQKYLFLYGTSGTGKSTLGRIILSIWGCREREGSGATIDTPARLGKTLSSGTFPHLIEEPGAVFTNEHLVDMLKKASTSIIVRAKIERHLEQKTKAYTPLIFASNRKPPKDDAFLRRIYLITFSITEKFDKDTQENFRKIIEPKLNLLSEIGNAISHLVLRNPELVLKSYNPIELGEILLRKCYELVGLESPHWLSLIYEEAEEPSTIYMEEFVEKARKYFVEIYTRHIKKIDREEYVDIKEIIETTLKKKLVEGIDLILKEGETNEETRTKSIVVIKWMFLNSIGLPDIDLRTLSYLLNAKYGQYKQRVGNERKPKKGVIISLKEFLDLFEGVGYEE